MRIVDIDVSRDSRAWFHLLGDKCIRHCPPVPKRGKPRWWWSRPRGKPAEIRLPGRRDDQCLRGLAAGEDESRVRAQRTFGALRHNRSPALSPTMGECFLPEKQSLWFQRDSPSRSFLPPHG